MYSVRMMKMEREKAEILRLYVSAMKMLQNCGKIVYNVLIFIGRMRYNRNEISAYMMQ